VIDGRRLLKDVTVDIEPVDDTSKLLSKEIPSAAVRVERSGFEVTTVFTNYVNCVVRRSACCLDLLAVYVSLTSGRMMLLHTKL
jgi:hypothetical protein